ncbi:hypothetical protein CBM2609_B30002 [Cupriavidus taiwanensis]|nr:hypothetical protein CBM2609_B30002 [Cupriavidus taiwanensis]
MSKKSIWSGIAIALYVAVDKLAFLERRRTESSVAPVWGMDRLGAATIIHGVFRWGSGARRWRTYPRIATLCHRAHHDQ